MLHLTLSFFAYLIAAAVLLRRWKRSVLRWLDDGCAGRLRWDFPTEPFGLASHAAVLTLGVFALIPIVGEPFAATMAAIAAAVLLFARTMGKSFFAYRSVVSDSTVVAMVLLMACVVTALLGSFVRRSLLLDAAEGAHRSFDWVEAIQLASAQSVEQRGKIAELRQWFVLTLEGERTTALPLNATTNASVVTVHAAPALALAPVSEVDVGTRAMATFASLLVVLQPSHAAFAVLLTCLVAPSDAFFAEFGSKSGEAAHARVQRAIASAEGRIHAAVLQPLQLCALRAVLTWILWHAMVLPLPFLATALAGATTLLPHFGWMWLLPWIGALVREGRTAEAVALLPLQWVVAPRIEQRFFAGMHESPLPFAAFCLALASTSSFGMPHGIILGPMALGLGLAAIEWSSGPRRVVAK